MSLHIKNGRVIDPASGRDAAGEVFVAEGKIVAGLKGKAEKIIDAKGLVLFIHGFGSSAECWDTMLPLLRADEKITSRYELQSPMDAARLRSRR